MINTIGPKNRRVSTNVGATESPAIHEKSRIMQATFMHHQRDGRFKFNQGERITFDKPLQNVQVLSINIHGDSAVGKIKEIVDALDDNGSKVSSLLLNICQGKQVVSELFKIESFKAQLKSIGINHIGSRPEIG